ncbi:serine O-acetyltransferase [Vibrio diabolicus]|uniref:serine O-acetyltransferase n=1 Tax=Vibrio harveyi group TaxID=717610 RepID=UPI00215E21DC|nr:MULTISPECIES: DapH/DapD/GlmU-related protein [Vibrio harveyi group]EGQ9809307.1 serine acetyltransferase [Vibrio parahaemolyticus]EJB8452832.1 serine acetyltransferase [Vibrio parahaemolyticus]EJG0014251.1 serine acetyltransferase [Vibrio parahaemolyticus]EJI6683776.1 serine acetyltransferase [Vibrio parahaemolyticus]EJL6386200.1 serine acetyltransferase [Vibrio parahaemolyticus]
MSKISIFFYRIAYILEKYHIPLLPKLINFIFVRIIMGCYIGLGAKLGKNVILGYGGLGCVIHRRAVIGNNVTIGTGVTIGGTSNCYNVPKIGDNSKISSGAKIIGPITIGSNCFIGVNSVVTKSIPDGCLVYGVPARIVKNNIDISKY